MPQAVIGNLRVDLGINTAEFAAGAADAVAQLTGLKGAFASFGKGLLGSLSLGAVAAALQLSINHMDELGKASQKIGIPVEELSKLEYAAKLSDVQFETLTSTIGKFSKNIAEIAGGGTNSASGALKAIGVAATDAQGRLRPTGAIINDVADEFAAMKDGAGKTALAMAMFGKTGAELIPLLNGGSRAIKEAGDQLAIFGGVVTKEAAAQAERYNDNLTKLGAAADGLRNTMATALLPTLVDVTDALVRFAENSNIGQAAADFFNGMLREVAKTAATTYEELYSIITVMGALKDAASDPLNWSATWDKAFEDIRAQSVLTRQVLADISGDNKWVNEWKALADNLADPWRKLRENAKTEAPIIPDLGRAKKAADEAAAALKKLGEEGKQVFEETRTPAEKYAADIANLDKLLAAHVITTETYGRAVQGLKADLFAADAGFQQLGTDFLTVAQSMAVDAQETIGKVGETLADNFADTFAGIISGTTSLKDAFSEMAQSISQELAQLAAQLLKSSIIKLLGIALGGLGGGGGTGINIGGMTFGGLFADGGSLGAGKWGIAGEAGPELVKGPAQMVPMDSMGRGGAMNVSVNNYANAEVKTRQRSDGMLEIDIIEKELATRVARGGSPLSAGISQGFGVRRAGR